ncbi:MAG: hypothetical protein O7I42_18760 [Alphaproteobacteria bacterium]|nr:hypothetical protein [Alphaproteobacteria bacterium]
MRVFEAANPSYVLEQIAPPSIEIPADFQEVLKPVKIFIRGQVAAFSHGQVALIQGDDVDTNILRLPKHAAVRVTTDRLSPVAALGDIILVKLFDKPKEGDLVLAAIGDYLRIGRLHYALTAEDRVLISPLQSRPEHAVAPIIVPAAACEIKVIDGVLFSEPQASDIPLPGGDVARLSGEAPLSILARTSLVAYNVKGDSAVPVALGTQFILVDETESETPALERNSGELVFVTSEGPGPEHESYFKRLHVRSPLAVLGSVDPMFPNEPIILSLGKDIGWPKLLGLAAVRGVIFRGILTPPA